MKPERIAELQALKAEAKAKTRGKQASKLSRKELDELTVTMARMMGLVPECDKRPTEL